MQIIPNVGELPRNLESKAEVGFNPDEIIQLGEGYGVVADVATVATEEIPEELEGSTEEPKAVPKGFVPIM